MAVRTEAEFVDYIREGFRYNPELIPGFLEWYQSRPPQVRTLMREFGIGDRILMDGQIWYIIGYSESDDIIVSPVNPREEGFNEHEMMAKRERICAEHLRDGSVSRLS